MSKRIIPPPPIKPDIPEEGFKAIGNPAFQKWAEDLSIWREESFHCCRKCEKRKRKPRSVGIKPKWIACKKNIRKY